MATPEEQIHNVRISLAKVTSDLPYSFFQRRLYDWMLHCFGTVITFDKTERNHRFLEESLETVQSLNCTREEAHQLVDYVYNRPIGNPKQEVGGAFVTLAALCIANGFNMEELGETELARIWTKVQTIRSKQATKPKRGPLPTCTHANYTFEKHGRYCPNCHVMMVDFGD